MCVRGHGSLSGRLGFTRRIKRPGSRFTSTVDRTTFTKEERRCRKEGWTVPSLNDNFSEREPVSYVPSISGGFRGHG